MQCWRKLYFSKSTNKLESFDLYSNSVNHGKYILLYSQVRKIWLSYSHTHTHIGSQSCHRFNESVQLRRPLNLVDGSPTGFSGCSTLMDRRETFTRHRLPRHPQTDRQTRVSHVSYYSWLRIIVIYRDTRLFMTCRSFREIFNPIKSTEVRVTDLLRLGLWGHIVISDSRVVSRRKYLNSFQFSTDLMFWAWLVCIESPILCVYLLLP